MKLEKQIEFTISIFKGYKLDKYGYCGCPKCGSRNLTHDGFALDYDYISCDNCHYSINGNDPYEMIRRWNLIPRNSFQLKIPFELPV